MPKTFNKVGKQKTEKMKTYFSKKDLVYFGNYLQSQARENSFIQTSVEASLNGIELEMVYERLKTVTHADVCNFIESRTHE